MRLVGISITSLLPLFCLNSLVAFENVTFSNERRATRPGGFRGLEFRSGMPVWLRKHICDPEATLTAAHPEEGCPRQWQQPCPCSLPLSCLGPAATREARGSCTCTKPGGGEQGEGSPCSGTEPRRTGPSKGISARSASSRGLHSACC